MHELNQKKAVIYARVSTPKQVKEGHSLEAQEARCREHAKHKGYEVVKVFMDEGVSGSIRDRPDVRAMITYLKRNKKSGPFVVIIDEVSRLARHVRAHMDLRDAIYATGAELESPIYQFRDDAIGFLTEQSQAMFADFFRRQNTERVIERMKTRVQNGYYVFAPVPGYIYADLPEHGKIIVPDPETAPIVKEALEGFATGRFQTMTEVKRFLDRHPNTHFVKTASGDARLSQIRKMLERSLYAGYITIEKWSVYLHPGKHEPLISLETWNKIQDRLKGVSNAPARKDINADFPLRGFVKCAECDHALQASWSKGRTKKYPYYFCQAKPCSQYGKSIRRADIEGEFADMLHSMKPTKKLLELTLDIFTKLWDHQLAQSKAIQAGWKKDVAFIEKKIDGLMGRIVETESDTLAKAYEAKIKKLEMERLTLKEKSQNSVPSNRPLSELYRTAIEFLSNPCKLWLSDVLEHKRLVLRLAFTSPLSYARNEGFKTAAIAEPIRLLGVFQNTKCEVVGPEGFEPPT